VILKLLGRHFLLDASDKDGVLRNFIMVRAKQFAVEVEVEWEGARVLTRSHLEVAHLFAGKNKLVMLRDIQDGRVEGKVIVTADEGHAMKDSASLLQKNFADVI